MTAAGVRTEASVFSNIPSSFYNHFQFWSNIEYGQDLKSLQSHIVGHPEGSCYFKCCRYISCKLRAYLHKMWMEGELVSTASHHPPQTYKHGSARIRPEEKLVRRILQSWKNLHTNILHHTEAVYINLNQIITFVIMVKRHFFK